MQHRHTASQFRLDIQGLRAVAVIAVIADHLLGWPSGGFVGVDIFFVISGFLITGILLREYDAQGTISFRNFYIRRSKRILPAATLVLVATVSASYPLLGFDRTKGVIQDAIASFFFLGNWQFALHGVDYFRQDMPPSPLQHYWSLSVEEQFYFIWPWLLLGLLLFGSRFFNWQRNHTRLVAGLAIAGISLISLAWCFYETASDPKFAYFSTLSRAWELGLGALIAASATFFSKIDKITASLLNWLGVTGIAASLWIIGQTSAFPAPWAMLPVVSAAIIIAAGCTHQNGSYFLRNPISQYIGKISYSLYLWHFPVAILLQYVFIKSSAAYYVVGLALTFLLSSVSFYLVEEPARKGTWFKWNSEKRLSGLSTGWLKFASAVLVFCFLSVLSTLLIDKLSLPEAKVPDAATAGFSPVAAFNCFGAAALDPRQHCPSLNPGPGVKPRPVDVTTDTQDAYDCYTFANQPLRSCQYGSHRKGAKRVALIGDSHAAALLPAFQPQLEALNWNLTVMTGNGCQWRDQTHRKNACAEAMQRRQEKLIAEQFDLIVATGIRTTPGTVAEYAAAMAPLLSRGQKIVVIEDVPDVAYEAVACTQRIGFSYQRDCITSATTAYADEDLLAQTAQQMGVPVVSLRNYFCIEDACPAAIGNVLVYRDTAAHITATYATTLGPYIVEGILSALTAKPILTNSRQ